MFGISYKHVFNIRIKKRLNEALMMSKKIFGVGLPAAAGSAASAKSAAEATETASAAAP